MEVTLVYPRLNRADFESGSIHMPLGILYLASYLRQNEINVNVVDCTFLHTWHEYIERMRLSDSDIIGFSFSSPMADLAFEAIRITKQMFPNALIIAGGPHPTVDPENTIKNENIDIVVIGEGEEILLELCKTYTSGSRDFSNIGRILFKGDDGCIKKSQVGVPFSIDLDKFGLLGRDLIDIEKYISVSGRVTLITSRGCPGKCTFCQPTLKSLFGTKIRTHSTDYVIRDMIQIRDKYYNNNFLIEIVDDTFCFNKQRVLNICNKIIENKLNKIPWWCINRVDFFDEQIAEALKKAGCIGLSLGIESGSNRILQKVMRKNINIDEIKRTFKICNKYGLLTVAFFMIGSPSETKEDLEMTNSIIKKIHPDVIAISVTTPIIGSELYKNSLKEGSLNISESSDYGYYGVKYPMKLELLSYEDISIYKRKFIKTWFTNTWRNVKKYISFCFSITKIRLAYLILERSLIIRFNWFDLPIHKKL